MLKKIDIILIIIAISFLLRAIYLYTFANNLFFNTFSDAAVYNGWAIKILSGSPPQPPFFLSPVYPYFLALVYTILGKGITQVLLIQIILDTITTYFIFKIATMIFNRKIGLLASLLYAIFPAAIFYAGLFLMPSLLAFLLTSGIYLLILAARRHNDTIFFSAGLVFGFAILGKGNVLLPALVPLFYFKRLKYLIGILIPILCLCTINITVGNDFAVTTYNLGLNFYIGNNIDAQGRYDSPGGLDLASDPDGRKTISNIQKREVTKSESSIFWTKKALSFIRKNPVRFAILIMKKFYYFWGPVEYPQFENLYYVLKHSLIKYLPLRFWLIVPFFLLSIVALNNREGNIIAIMTFFYSIAFLPFFVIGRFRQPVMPMVVMLGSAFIYLLFMKIKERQYTILIYTIPVSLIYTFLIVVNQPTIKEFDFGTRSDYAIWSYYNNRSKVFFDSTKAILIERPDYVKSLVNLGNYYFRIQQYHLARRLYERARKIEPENGETNANLGTTLLALNKPDSAIYYLKIAKELMPYNIKIDSSIFYAQNLLKKNSTND